MPMIYEDECKAADIDSVAVERIARRLERVARDAQKLGIQIFGGTGSATLRQIDGSGQGGRLILADIDAGSWDGGDGGYRPDENGLNRGE